MTETTEVAERIITINGITGVVNGESDDWITIERTDDKGGVERYTHNKHAVVILPGAPAVVDELVGLVVDVEPTSLTDDADDAPADAEAEIAVLDALPNLDDDAAAEDAKPAPKKATR